MWNIMKNSNNPEQIFNEALNKNPEFKKLMSTINALGDPKTAFYELAKKQGKDPNSILSLLK